MLKRAYEIRIFVSWARDVYKRQAQTEADLENAILTKARQLNLSNAG